MQAEKLNFGSEGISKARYITAGDAARQRAENYAKKRGGKIAEAYEVYRVICDDITETFGCGYTVVAPNIKHKTVKCNEWYAKLV